MYPTADLTLERIRLTAYLTWSKAINRKHLGYNSTGRNRESLLHQYAVLNESVGLPEKAFSLHTIYLNIKKKKPYLESLVPCTHIFVHA